MFKTNLVETKTSDDLILSGLLNRPAIKKDTAVLFIHGFIADFYTHKFVKTLAETAVGAGHAFLSAQTRGTGLHTEFLKGNRIDAKYIGSYFELLEEAFLDIDAWLNYLHELGYSKFILVGHSLGTLKVVRYLFEGSFKGDVTKVSLLGPFDKNAYVEKKSGGKWHDYVVEAKKKIDEGKGLEFIPDTYDDFPMTYQTFYSWYRPSDFNEMWDFYRKTGYSYPIWDKVKVPVQIVTGSIDESLEYPEFYTREEVYEIMCSKIKDLDLKVIEGSGHCFVGYEEQLVEAVRKFL